jgi:tetratricopeptide (TPR) repeat protein
MIESGEPNATVKAMLAEARIFDRQGRIPEAIEVYKRLLVLRPGSPNTWYNLASLQRKIRRFTDALTSYQEALDRGVARPEEAHLNRGVIYAEHLQQDDAAERELVAALDLNAAYVPALLNLASLHEDRGQRALAAEIYERILVLDPSCWLALARYANLNVFSNPDDPLIGKLRDAIAGPTNSVDRADLGFALGRALDGCGNYAAAFDAYTAANLQSRQSVPPGYVYDPAQFERVVDELIAAFPTPQRSVPTRGGAPHPIFVCGMFRSGSTLAEQILAGHPRVVAGGELDFLPHTAQQSLAPFPGSMISVSPQVLEMLATQYLDKLAGLFPGAEFVTDKRPDNFLYLGLIKRLFPDAKIVHTTRDPLDNCLSVFFLHLDHSVSYALDLMHTGHYYRQYRRLMAHWKSLYAEDIIDVNYDDLVRDPSAGARRLLGFLGLAWDERCLSVPPVGRVIKTASLWQVREPIHVRSSGRARHYEPQLAALRDYFES